MKKHEVYSKNTTKVTSICYTVKSCLVLWDILPANMTLKTRSIGRLGMLHDIDFELYPEEHCSKCCELLRAHDIDEQMIRSIVSHGYGRLDWVTVAPKLHMEKILFATDELSGLIGTCAMVRPSKSVRDMDVGSIKKKFKKKEFAVGCCREDIVKGAEMLDITLDELMQRTLDSMKNSVDVLNI